ncbi:MAG: phoA 3 [Paenibacillaceae bacterium]|nr:phoA 3 [Paenibacillaceae bacterium]
MQFHGEFEHPNGQGIQSIPSGGGIQFAVIGCGPAKLDEERQLEQAMRHNPAVKDGAFLVHLGNVESHRSFKDEEPYRHLAELLRLSERPTFVLPGRTEWSGSPDRREMWRNHLMRLETFSGFNGPHGDKLQNELQAERQSDHPENFAFVKDGVLFIGIDLPGGEDVASVPGFEDQLASSISWVERWMSDAQASVRAAVIFAHAFPGLRHQAFGEALHVAVRRFAKPVLYLHTDSHYLSVDRPHRTGPEHTNSAAAAPWCEDRPWTDVDLLRVRTDRFGSAPPLRVTVRTDASGDQGLFELDRQYFRGPYLNKGTPHSMTILWRTGRRIQPEVRVGKAPLASEQIYGSEQIQWRTTETSSGSQALHSSPDGVFQYHVTIKSLDPATKYYYAIYDGERLLAGGDEEHFFHTSPVTGSETPLRFWIFGDSGKDNQPQHDVHRAMLAYTEAQNRPIDLFLHCGDMAYTHGLDSEFQTNFFRPYQETLRHTVLWPTMSNHEGHTSDGNTDSGPYYDAFILPKAAEAGGVPSGTSSYFGFDYGQVHFVCLCSFSIRLDSESDQAKWLRADLEHVRKQGLTKWIVAYFHHPAYTKGSHDSDTEKALVEVREHLYPILEEGGVDLIFCGHSHTYERTMLVNRAYDTPTIAEGRVLDDGDGDPQGDGPYRKSATIQPHEGIVQVVIGTGGTKIGRRGTLPLMKTVLMENGSMLVDVQGDTLTAIMLNDKGEIRDRFAIVREGQAKPQPIAKPRQLRPYVSYARLAVRLGLETMPDANGDAVAVLEVQQGAADVAATLVWQTAGTNWQAEANELPVQIGTDAPARVRIRLKCTGDLFPMPRAAIVFRSPEPEERRALSLELPSHRTLTLQRLAERPTIDGRVTPEKLAALAGGAIGASGAAEAAAASEVAGAGAGVAGAIAAVGGAWAPESGFIRFNGAGLSAEPTTFYAGISGDWLYLAAVCQESNMSELFVNRTEGDAAHFSDDCLEVFLQQERSKNFYHFTVNCNGQRLDARNGSKPRNLEWEGEWESAVQRHADHWTAELLIRLSMFDEPVKPGDALRLNVARNHAAGRQYSQWAYTGQNVYATGSYGCALVPDGE